MDSSLKCDEDEDEDSTFPNTHTQARHTDAQKHKTSPLSHQPLDPQTFQGFKSTQSLSSTDRQVYGLINMSTQPQHGTCRC